MSSSASGLGLILAGLETRQNVKSKCMDIVYSCSAFYKKPKKPVASNVIDLSASSLSMENISSVGESEIGSIAGSISNLLDVENMTNIVTEETSYAELGKNNNMDDTMPRKTCTQTYVLCNSLKQSFFESMSDNDIALKLPPCIDIRCVVICFENEASKLAAIGSVPVFKDVSLHWASLLLACCAKCKQFGHVSDMCLIGGNSGVCGNNKTWAQVVGDSSSLLGSLSPLGTGLSLNAKSFIGAWSSSNSADPHGVSSLFNHLVFLEWSLELLTNQVFDIVRKLSFMKLVPLPSVSYELSLAVSTPLAPKVNSDMILDGMPKPSASFLSAVVDDISGFSSSSSKILTTKGKLSVSVLSLYAGASTGICFGQASEVNSIIAKAVNTSTFMVLDENFNEYRSERSASFKFCLSLGLVNLFNGHHLVKAPMWCNSRSAERIIDYIFVSESLFFIVIKCWVSFVSNFFNSDHNAVVVLLNGLSKQANKDHWKFKIKNVDSTKWSYFRDCSSIRILMIKVRFLATTVGHDLDAMWSLLEGALMDSTDEIFSRLWFSNFQCSKNKQSFKFLGLELLAAKIVKRLKSGDTFRFDCLVEKWSTLDADKTLVLRDMSKMYELKLVQEAFIRVAIEKRMEKFCSNKSSIIKSVLNRPFWKVVLDHLVVDNELVLDPDEIKLNVDRIMEDWTRKHVVSSYAPLDYVRDNVFSGVMDAINMSELLVIVGGLSDDKATGLSGIPNKLWKHDSKSVMKCLLVLLNECLFVSAVLMISKFYDWNKILMNTHPIALIETVRKILSNRIFFACNKFGILCSDNFLVLKSTSIQVLVFAIGSVVENTLEKNKELWLHIKMCDRFIKFFGSIYEDRINRMMTDFGFSNSYRVYDEFFMIYYCVKLKGMNIYFVVKSDRVESSGGMFSFFVAGAFVDDTIWVKDCQTSMQYALDIAGKFFSINDISINSKKTSVKVASLDINGQPISIAKRGKAHRYLEIFLSTEGLSKPSLAKIHLNVHFFANVVLRKAITDKQFSYLVSAVLQPIVNYCIQFSFVSSNVYHKWNVLVRKSLKLKAGLPHDFLDAALYHPSLYGLKSFKQIQAESKLAAVVTFSNALGILGHFVAGSAAAYFFAIDHSIGVRIYDLMSSILAELQAVALALECVLSSSAVTVYFDSQAAINAYVSKLSHPMPDFRVLCWMEKCYIFDLIREKDLSISWVKVKGYFGVCRNIKADAAAGAAVCSQFSLPIGIWEWLLIAENTIMSGNVHYFVRDLFRFMCQAYWEAGPDHDVIWSSLIECVDWSATLRVWHSDLHMLARSTNWKSSVLQLYLMKTVYY
ncbi:hypothetical protein G9A89_022822 [Geosiphon pyriformis]|nr:hypothetical protein G9A89_022822 [Geosiphon pyriformis]